ncbi:MAG: murein biosynthesis integral membrane protein MurJ [Nitrospiraceae bacterium]|nr:MAG: murein biosynthesis integral membrane protein MurJ [Nitrospiraceae bacterium]
MDEKRNITKAAGLMSAATFISRILGYVKDMILAVLFGATGLSDTFFVAFRIPNLLRELFAEGSMSSAFIPVLTEYQTKHGAEEAKRLVRTTFTAILIIVGAICIAGIIFAPAIVTAIAPGFLKTPGKFSLTVMLTRTMFPFLLFVSLAALVMGALNTRRIFFVPALAPAILNIVTIAVVLLLAYRIEQPIAAVAIGVALGGFVQFAFQLPSFFRNGYSLKPEYGFSHPGLKKMSLLVLPATMGMAVTQINIFISTILASYLQEGSITYLYYSMRLIQFPVGIFGVAMGMAVLPALSSHAAKGEIDNLRSDFSFALRMLFFMTVPAMARLIALRGPIVNILFQRGRFEYAATLGTADALLFYSFGIWAIVGVRIVTAGFYSMQDTKTPVKIAVIAMITNIALSLVLLGPMKHSGLALANAAAASVNFCVLFFMLRKKLGSIDGRKIAGSFMKISAASAVTGLMGWSIIRGDMWTQSGMIAEKAGALAGVTALYLTVYFLIMHLLGSEELKYLVRMYRERKKKG